MASLVSKMEVYSPSKLYPKTMEDRNIKSQEKVYTSCSSANRRSCKACFLLSKLACRAAFPLACSGLINQYNNIMLSAYNTSTARTSTSLAIRCRSSSFMCSSLCIRSLQAANALHQDTSSSFKTKRKLFSQFKSMLLQ